MARVFQQKPDFIDGAKRCDAERKTMLKGRKTNFY
jgi:hypothetical protein